MTRTILNSVQLSDRPISQSHLTYTADTKIDLDRTSGLSFRKPTYGPELELVWDYIDGHLPSVPRGQCRSVFVEPRLESGFPDAVIVDWHVATTRQWETSRAHLTKSDVRLLHYLSLFGPFDNDHLQSIFYRSVDPSLKRLHEAGLIRRTCHAWKAKALNSIFAVRRIIAIEAKISEWRRGLQQAIQNTWFASESFLLLPSLPSNANLVQAAVGAGVGIVTSCHPMDNSVVPSRKANIPISYASWLFNEWVWRIARLE